MVEYASVLAPVSSFYTESGFTRVIFRTDAAATHIVILRQRRPMPGTSLQTPADAFKATLAPTPNAKSSASGRLRGSGAMVSTWPSIPWTGSLQP
jgi:hypothetical protein